ncbi:13419_t:CDS:1, partial [Ambispora gerdemannii]
HDYLYVPVTIMETDIPKTERVLSMFAKVHLLDTIMKIDIPKTGHVFLIFAKARAVIERYAAKINAVLILEKISKNSDRNDYRQAFFVCEKQEKYDKKNKKYTTK